jgi:hypothetical protein
MCKNLDADQSKLVHLKWLKLRAENLFWNRKKSEFIQKTKNIRTVLFWKRMGQTIVALLGQLWLCEGSCLFVEEVVAL